tara:strand:- start:8 stop:496 length:489 start_codon:yes stop_codon:yes gene_type:complete
MKVIDNFLDKESFEKIKNGIVNNTYFPWYFSEFTDYLNEKGLEKNKYIHTFYRQNKPNSQHYDLLLPFLEKLNCTSLIKIKLNSTSHSTKLIEGTYHCDFTFKCKTAVYYLNTNDGYTKFQKDNKIIQSIENRMVIFNSNLKHLGTNTTDSKRRLVLNFNYF